MGFSVTPAAAIGSDGAVVIVMFALPIFFKKLSMMNLVHCFSILIANTSHNKKYIISSNY